MYAQVFAKSYPVKIIDSFYGWLDGYQQEVW